MDPETGELHELTPEGELAPGEPVPDGWPVFTVGEPVELKGQPFIIARINVSSVVLRPDPEVFGDRRARDVIDELVRIPPADDQERVYDEALRSGNAVIHGSDMNGDTG